MKCTDTHKELLFLVEGSSTKEKKEELEKHISECKACKILYKEMNETFNLIEKEKVTEINPFFFTRIEERMKNKVRERNPIFSPTLRRAMEPLMLAAVIAIGLFFGVLIGNNTESNTEFANVEEEFAKEFYFENNELAYQSIEEYLIEEE